MIPRCPVHLRFFMRRGKREKRGERERREREILFSPFFYPLAPARQNDRAGRVIKRDADVVGIYFRNGAYRDGERRRAHDARDTSLRDIRILDRVGEVTLRARAFLIDLLKPAEAEIRLSEIVRRRRAKL